MVKGKLVILGAGGNALDTLDVVDALNRASATWQVEGILDDRRAVGSTYLGLPILGPLKSAADLEGRWFTSSIWNERTFGRLHAILETTRLSAERFATLVHPQSAVSERASLGHGVVVNYGASIAGNVQIGDFVSIGPNCVIGHDSVLEGYSAIAAGAIVSGGVKVERNCYIGSGASIRQQLRIGRGCLIGLGAVLVSDAASETVMVGNPARPMRKESNRNSGVHHAEQ